MAPEKDLLHQRNISINCYEIGETTLLVEGTLSDERFFASLIYSANERRQPGFVHTMKVAMKVSLPRLEILEVTATTPVTPMDGCALTAAAVQQLKGKRIKSGFTAEVRQLIGGTKGCLHTLNLIIAMASAVIQGSWSYYSRIRDDGALRPPRHDETGVVNSCWMWREDGPLVARYRQAKQGLKNVFVIVLDGPAGSGKSTAGRILARRLGFAYLDTGAIYRALALKLSRMRMSEEDAAGIEEVCATTAINFQGVGADTRILLDGEDVSSAIRSEAVGLLASKISAIPAVRTALLGIQRQAGEDSASTGGIVAEGRDMGSVVFPLAPVKVFLTADTKARAARRYRELREQGGQIAMEAVMEDIMARDQHDSTREVSPLVVAPGAIVIDTSNMEMAEVVERIMEIVREKRAGAG